MKWSGMFALLCMLAISMLTLQGCGALVLGGAGAAAGYAGTKYANGNVERTYNAPMERTYNAAVSTLKESEVSITDTERETRKVTIHGVRSDGQPVRITLRPVWEKETSADIRVGKLGDVDAAKVLEQRMSKKIS